MTPTTSNSVASIVIWTSPNAARIVRERSWRGARCAVGGSCASSAGSSALDRVGHLDGVAARLPHDLHRDRAFDVDVTARILLVEPVAVVDALDAVDDVRDLFEPDGRALAVGDDDRAEGVRVVQLACRFDVVGGSSPEQLACRLVHVPVGERRVDLVDADVLRVELLGVDLDPHGVLRRRPAPAPATRR